MSLIARKLLRDPSAVVGLLIVLGFAAVALCAEWLAPFPLDAYETHILQRLKPPNPEFLFGTDALGRDIYSRVVLGATTALTAAPAVVIIAALIGVSVGLIAGYLGGWLAEIVMRITDIFLSVPQLVLALALAQILTPSLESAMLALTLTYWPFFTRIVFAETQRLKSSVFIEAIESLGAGRLRVMIMHILPNIAAPIIVRLTIGMGFIILMIATLGFLGMGAPPPTPEWGLTIAESRHYLPDAWWFALFPGLAILFLVLGFNLLGDGIHDVIDPRLRRSR